MNRIKQFRLSYITAADGLHKNHQIVYGQEFIIRVSKVVALETPVPDVDRTIAATIYPPAG